MENTEVKNVEKIEVMEPVVTEVSGAVSNETIGAVGGFIAGAVVCAGVMALVKFAIKPVVRKLTYKIVEKKFDCSTNQAGVDPDVNIATVDFEEIKDLKTE